MAGWVPTVHVTSLAAAALDFRRHRCNRAVSLVDPGLAPPSLPGLDPSRHLLRQFHDIDGPEPGFVMPCRGLVADLVAFGRALVPGDRVLVHCVAGVSRSPAAAAVILCAATGGTAAAAHLLAEQGPFMPNPAILAMGDDSLGMGGRLRALADAVDAPGAFEW